MIPPFSIVPTELLSAYLRELPKGLQEGFDALHEADISTGTFSFYTSVSSVFSSKIEGEDIELDSYIKHKRFGIEFYRITPKRLMISTVPTRLQKVIR